MHEETANGTGRVWVRRTLVAAAGAVAVVVLGLVLATLLLPRERIARAASVRAEAALGTEVVIEGVDLDFWPAPAVALEGVRIGDREGSSGALDRVLLRPRLLALLGGRVVIDELALDRPIFDVFVDSAGEVGLPSLDRVGDAGARATGDAEVEPGPTAGEREVGDGPDIAFAIQGIRIDDGRIAYRDARDGTDVRVSGLRQRLALDGEIRGGELSRIRLDGDISIDSVDAVLPGRLAAPIRGLPVTFEHDAVLDREADRLAFDRLRVEVGRLGLDGEGTVEALSDTIARRVRLALRADTFEIRDVMRTLPVALPGASGGAAAAESDLAPELGGRAAIRVRVEGPAGVDTLPDIEGALDLAGLSVALDDGPALEALHGTIPFSWDSVATPGIEGRFFGEPFRLAFAVRDLADPVIDFSTSGDIALDRVTGAAALEAVALAGRTPFDLRGRVPLGEPGAATLDGTIGLSGVRVTGDSLLAPVSVEDGRLAFEGGDLRVTGLRLTLGDSPLEMEAAVDEVLALALRDTTAAPRARFDLVAGRLDLDALLGPSESPYPRLLFARLADRRVDGRSVDEVAAEQGLSLPPALPVAGRGRVRAEAIVRNELEYTDVDARIEFGPDGLRITDARFGLMGGTVALTLALRPAGADGGDAGDAAAARGGEGDGIADRAADLEIAYELDGLRADAFFTRLTPLREHLAGTLGMSGTAAMRLDGHALPIRETVRAGGTAALSDGRLANWPLLRAVGDRLGLAGFDTLAIRDWMGAFRIDGPRFSLEETVQRAGRYAADVDGWFDVGGGLDVNALMRLPADLASSASESVRSVAAALSGESGEVPLGLRLTGTAASPSIALDLSDAREAVTSRAREAAEREAREVADRAREEVEEEVAERADELAERAGIDSIPADPDSLREEADSAARAVADSLAREAIDSATRQADSAARSVVDSVRERLPGLPFLRGRDDDDEPADTTPPDTTPPDTTPPDTTTRPDTTGTDTTGAVAASRPDRSGDGVAG